MHSATSNELPPVHREGERKYGLLRKDLNFAAMAVSANRTPGTGAPGVQVRRLLRVRKDVTFVSSNRWDAMGAARFGFNPVWVNRAKNPDEYPDHRPMEIVPDLTALTA
jgi:hypothetical protein